MSGSEGEDADAPLDDLINVIDAFASTYGPNSSKKPTKKKVKRKRKKNAGSNADDVFEYDWPPCACGRNHPPIPIFNPPNSKLCTYYWQIAEMFPFMTIHRVLSTEVNFQRADTDQSGVIEESELTAILAESVNSGRLTKSMIHKTFAEIDTDNSGTIDFLEVLDIVDSIIQRRKTNLPAKVRDDFSKVCSLQ